MTSTVIKMNEWEFSKLLLKKGYIITGSEDTYTTHLIMNIRKGEHELTATYVFNNENQPYWDIPNTDKEAVTQLMQDIKSAGLERAII